MNQFILNYYFLILKHPTVKAFCKFRFNSAFDTDIAFVFKDKRWLPIGVLHTGQVFVDLNHDLIHDSWKQWPQGNWPITWPFTKFSKHIAHSFPEIHLNGSWNGTLFFLY
jgi:hypothetical protein